jgi:hypothetical protein
VFATRGAQTFLEQAVSSIDPHFRPTPDGYFMARRGPAWGGPRPHCPKKLCFVATDRALLAEILGQLAERPDCDFVKFSLYQKDGMYLGRCFLVDEDEVGVLWAHFKAHPRLFCSIQDDDFVARFRGS